MLERETQHSNGDHMYNVPAIVGNRGSVHSRRLLYLQLLSFWSEVVSIVQSREVARILEVRNTLDAC